MKTRRSWAWRHKTKVVGVGITAGTFVQTNLAQVGKALSPHLFEAIVAAAGGLVFVLGFVNQFLPPDDAL